MSATRLLILGIGFVAAIVAAFLAVNLTSSAPETIRQVIETPSIKTTKILVASRRLNRGDVVGSSDLKWTDWPKGSVSEKHITQTGNPKALEDRVGDTVRFIMEEGDPAHENKFVKEGSGFMAAVLEPGKRAVSTTISAGTAAGGFILPDDRVDVMITRSLTDATGEQFFSTEPVLRNVRVLAIDQEIQEKDGRPVVVGKTATLELTDDQVRILAISQQLADSITLALRSLQDADQEPSADGRYLLGDLTENGENKTDGVVFVRYGNRVVEKLKK